MKWFPAYNYILASKSPRRQELLKSIELDFRIEIKEIDETYPDSLRKEEIPVYLAKLKAEAFVNELNVNDLLITADTIVWLNGKVLGKPADADEAKKMLRLMSGKEHQVYTGVCLTSVSKQISFSDVSNVRFKELSESEIDYYVENFKPFDKAGAYGIQEWIGYIGITHIEGSFFNVMGLPVQKLYGEIMRF